MPVAVKAKQWGNSIGVIIPKHLADNLYIRPGDEVVIDVERKHNVLKELWGALKFDGKPTKQLVGEARKELESKWDDV